jgi:hypothetical protein
MAREELWVDRGLGPDARGARPQGNRLDEPAENRRHVGENGEDDARDRQRRHVPADGGVRADRGAEHEQNERETGQGRPEPGGVPRERIPGTRERRRRRADDREEHDVEGETVETRRVGTEGCKCERQRQEGRAHRLKVRAAVGWSCRVTLGKTTAKGDRCRTPR